MVENVPFGVISWDLCAESSFSQPMSSIMLRDLPAPPKGKTGWPWTEQSELLPESQPNGSSWPKISIVTPSYNQGQFIEETIRSILLQGYPNLEYIVMDGGSDDNTVEILKRYDPWIDHWVSEPDDGQAQAINDGLSMATGDILAYLNSDDYYYPDAFGHVAQALSGSAATLFCAAVAASEEKVWHPPSSEDIGEWVRYTMSFPQQGCFWKDSDVVPQFDPNLNCAFDRKFFMQMILKSVEVEKSERVIARFREHSDSKTNTLSFFQENKRVDKEIVNSTTGEIRSVILKNKKIKSARNKMHREEGVSLKKAVEIAYRCPYILREREFYGYVRKAMTKGGW